MYKLLLTLRYLRRKLTPIFALAAVALCTAMVMIVLSIMGGFLSLVETTGKSMIGDVTISAGLSGVPYYEELIERLEAKPEIVAATPIIQTLGLLKLQGLDDSKGVQVVGVDPASIGKVIKYADVLYWNKDRAADHQIVGERFGHHDPAELGQTLQSVKDHEGTLRPTLVMGIEVNSQNRRTKKGQYEFTERSVIWTDVKLTLVPVTPGGGVLDSTSESFRVVNEFHSGLYEVDANFVYVRLDYLQKLLRMDEGTRILRDEDGERIGTEKWPPRVTTIEIRGADGVDPMVVRDATVQAYREVQDVHLDLRGYNVGIRTWRQRQNKLLSAVANEKGLMAFLFGIISLVAVVMVGVIFYMIVMEKTRDIGTLRALGASQPGVASIFLAYGGVIGTLGAGLGTLLAYLIVTNINEIHGWFGDGFGAVRFFLQPMIAGAILYAVIGFAHVAIKLMFSRGRTQILFAQMIFGTCLGLAVAIVMIWIASSDSTFYFYKTIHAADGSVSLMATVFLGIGSVVLTVLGVLLIDTQYWVFEKMKKLTRRASVGLFTLTGMAAGVVLAIILFNTGDHSVLELNATLGFQIWDRSVYFFDKIPSKMDPTEVTVIATVAVASSVIGSIIPAVRAAMVDPVESLRYE
jgi:lipoprotein-releasing system permease protein